MKDLKKNKWGYIFGQLVWVDKRGIYHYWTCPPVSYEYTNKVNRLARFLNKNNIMPEDIK